MTPKITIIEPISEQLAESQPENTPKLRVAAYARVSTEQDEQQSSYEAQVDYYTRYIAMNPDWEFAGIFSDEGITGTNRKYREGFNKMIAAAKEGKIDLILTKSISRFARNTVDTLQTVRELKALGVEVIFEKENLHTMDPKCEVMLTIMSSLAQEESRSISENVRWGQRKSMADGKVHLAYSHFLGYRKGENGRPEIVEEEAVIVRRIYQSFLDGHSIREIASSLTADGIPTPSGKTNWSVSTVKSILTNEKYKGDAILQKTYTVDYLTKEIRKNDGDVRQYHIEGSHPAIIDPATFDRVQEIMESHAAPGRKYLGRHPFAGKIVCASCGSCYGHKVWRNRNNTRRTDIWYCNSRYGKGKICASPILKEETIQAAFCKVLAKIHHPATDYSDSLWQELVGRVTVEEGHLTFELTTGKDITVTIPE